jgi:hypothetical protein
MKNSYCVVFLACLLQVFNKSTAQPVYKHNGEFMGVFDGRTPCQELSVQLDEKKSPECTKIKWRLRMFKDNTAGMTGTYELQGFIYKKEAPYLDKWHIITGTATNPDVIVYQLDREGRPPLLLQQCDDNVLYFLDKDKKLLVGNRDFSYTLNRVPGKL